MNRKHHPPSSETLSPLSSGCVSLFLKRDAFCPHHGGQSYYTVELAKAQVEVATISGTRPLLTMGRPLYWSYSVSYFLRVWARSRYAVYILGGSVCAPKHLMCLYSKPLKPFQVVHGTLGGSLGKETVNAYQLSLRKHRVQKASVPDWPTNGQILPG